MATVSTIRYEEADAELLPFAAASFDIAVSRHLLWTLPHPERAMDEWIRVPEREVRPFPDGRLGAHEIGTPPSGRTSRGVTAQA
jgi:ubiquinone/menaquinone biosynthesis C-methylase UbiE